VYSPLVNPELALQRRSVVLERMAQAGFIDAGELADARATPLQLKPALPKYWNSRAPFFTGWVAQELPKVLSAEQLEVGGLTIRSSLNQAWQEEGQKVIDSSAYGGLEGALVTVEPGTGLVRAMVGGKDFNKSQFNRATQALRSPGSTFKLFVYLSALKAGMKPEDTVLDAKRCFAGYCPKNFGDRYLGRVSLATALQNSLNTVAVSLLQQVGFDKVIATAQSLGITRELGRYYPMALGAYEQTVLDMTTAYAAVINRGVYVPATPFEEINGPNGELLWSRRVDGDKGRRAVDSDIADAMVWMLERVVSGGTGGAASLSGRPVAGKTGTSEGARDLWFIGGIPQLTTGVWLGYDNNRKTGSDSGSAAAAWGRYMSVVVKDLPVKQFAPKPVLTGTFRPTRAARSTFQQGRPSDLPTPGEDRGRTEPSQTPPPSERGSDLPPLPDLPTLPPPSRPPEERQPSPEPLPAPEPAPAPIAPSFPVAPPPLAPPPPVAPPPVP
jgi:penicillin-binding protein 1A